MMQEPVEQISTSQAQTIAKKEFGINVSQPTIIVWTKKHNLGKQMLGEGGRWYIDAEKLRAFLKEGDQS